MKYTPITLAVAASLLAGCATGPADNAVLKTKVEATRAEAQRLISSRETPMEASPVSYTDQSWVPLRKLDKSEQDTANANAKADTVQIEINQRFGSLNEVAGAVSSLTGLPVFVGADIRTPSASGSASAAPMPGGAPSPSIPSIPGGPLPPTGYSSAFGTGSSAPTGPITVGSPFAANYSGSLSGFMNMVSAYYGVFWKTETSGLRFFQMDSKTFRIAALPGDTRLSSTVEASSNSSGGGAGGAGGPGGGGDSGKSGSSANSTGVAFTGLSVWASLENGIKQMLSAGGRVYASPATGTITVTDTPNVLGLVSDFVKTQNQALNRQVSVNVRVLSVALDDADDYGINWDAVYKNLATASNAYSIALRTAFPVANGAGNLVISAPATSGSRWAGSSAMISALSSQGRVTELTSSTLVTLNNQPSPVNVGRRVSYLASSSTTQTANVGSTSSLTPGTIQTGFSMTLIPHIIDSREILLQYSIDLSSLLQLTTISSGTSSIQAPDISTSNFIQRVKLLSGETLVVAGFDQDNLSAVSNGVGAADNVALGSRNGSKKRNMIVVMIQPNLAL